MQPEVAAVLGSVRDWISRHRLFDAGQRVLVGLSGGPDSVVLLHVLLTLQEELGLGVEAAHLHHGLRGEAADRDEAFVQDLCRRWEVPLHTRRLPAGYLSAINSLSLEEAARRERLAFLRQVASRRRTERIALGHQKDDQAETVLMAVLRGAGPRGLAGIPPRRGPFVRPLLGVTRQQIEEYCRVEGLRFHRDESNLDVAFLRNRIRHELIPHLEREFNPQLRDRLAEMAEVMRAEQKHLWRETGRAFRLLARTSGFGTPAGASVVFSRAGLQYCEPALQRRLLRLAYQLVAGVRRGPNFIHIEEARQMLGSGQVGASLDWPEGVRAYLTYDDLVVSAEPPPGAPEPFCRQLTVPGTTPIPQLKTEMVSRVLTGTRAEAFKAGLERLPRLARHAYIDYNKVVFPLALRRRRPGDSFRPLGLNGTQKIKDFFIAEKIPRHKRDHVPLVVDDQGSIVWVVGFRIDDRYRVERGTESILHMWMKPVGSVPAGNQGGTG